MLPSPEDATRMITAFCDRIIDILSHKVLDLLTVILSHLQRPSWPFFWVGQITTRVEFVGICKSYKKFYLLSTSAVTITSVYEYGQGKTLVGTRPLSSSIRNDLKQCNDGLDGGLCVGYASFNMLCTCPFFVKGFMDLKKVLIQWKNRRSMKVTTDKHRDAFMSARKVRTQQNAMRAGGNDLS